MLHVSSVVHTFFFFCQDIIKEKKEIKEDIEQNVIGGGWGAGLHSY